MAVWRRPKLVARGDPARNVVVAQVGDQRNDEDADGEALRRPRCGLPEPSGAAGAAGLVPPQPHRSQHRPGRVLPADCVPAIVEDEERFCAMCGRFGERDGFSEALEREGLALGDAQYFFSNQTANLRQSAQRIRR